MNLELSNLKNIRKEKIWYFNEKKNYNNFIGKKTYICTKWDYNKSPFNIKNYGTLLQINKDYVSFTPGLYSNTNLIKHVYYSNEESRLIYIQINKLDIKKEYYKIRKQTCLNQEEKTYLYKKLIFNNFICI